jgi:hypothetical protein
MPASDLTSCAAGQASSAASTDSFDVLDEDCAVEVLHAAKAAGTLGALATSSRHVCSLARSKVPVKLRVVDHAHAALCARGLARQGLAFSGCTQLGVEVETEDALDSVASILSTAQQYPALQQLQLKLTKPLYGEGPGQGNLVAAGSSQQSLMGVDQRLGGVFSALPGLQQVQSMELAPWKMSPGIADVIRMLVQLTRLQLDVETFSPAIRLSAPALRPFTNLVDLYVHNPPPLQPPAAAGPADLPSSVTRLTISSSARDTPQPQGSWLAHLYGCPQLQDLTVKCTGYVDDSAHPKRVMRLLGRHNRQVRSFRWQHSPGESGSRFVTDRRMRSRFMTLGESWAAAPPRLEQLAVTKLLIEKEDWPHPAALQSLTQLVGAHFRCVPVLPAGASLRLLELLDCTVCFGGYDVAQVLMACPLLERASFAATTAFWARTVEPTSGHVDPHPCLKVFDLSPYSWGDIASSEFSVLAPALAGVADLSLDGWPPLCSVLPDLSQCTAVTALSIRSPPPSWSQEGLMSMVAPLVHLQRLKVVDAPQLSAEMAVVLQQTLPKLKQLDLS